MKPYYEQDGITIYHGDCREIDAWLAADVLVTDPPYGIAWAKGVWKGGISHDGIANDDSTEVRDWVLDAWGGRPSIMFGSPVLPPPSGTKQTLVWRKPPNSGFFGCTNGWRRDWESIYLAGPWPAGFAARSSVIETPEGMGSYLNGNGHPHSKPVSLMMRLIETTTGVIADPFMGSGPVARAAMNFGRTYIGIEIEERYCEIAAKRLAQGVLALEVTQ